MIHIPSTNSEDDSKLFGAVFSLDLIAILEVCNVKMKLEFYFNTLQGNHKRTSRARGK